MTTYRIIVNPAAGGWQGERHLDEIGALCDEAGLDYRIRRTTKPGQARNWAKEAAEEGIDIVVGAGGDGTLHEIAGGLMTVRDEVETLPALGILPIGTGNDYIKTHCIPSSIDPAFARLLEGKRRTVDVGVAGDVYFLNNLGVGFDAHVTAEKHNVKSRYITGATVYLYAVFRTLLSYEPMALRLELEDGSICDGTYHLVSVGIGRVCGGGFHLAPDAEPDDGQFDIHCMRAVPKWKGLRHMLKIKRGDFEKLDFIEMKRTPSLTLTADEPFIYHADGEVYESDEPTMRIETLPGALDILV